MDRMSDVSGEPIPGNEGGQVQFSYRGVDYAIYLTPNEAIELEEVLAYYARLGTKTAPRATHSPTARSAANGSRPARGS